MSDKGLQRVLADQIAERFPSAADVDRIADSIGLPLGKIARHARPVDHWSSAIAVAIERGEIGRLIEAVRVEMPALPERFGSLAAAPRVGEGPPSMELFLDWIGVKTEDPWRVEARGKRCPLRATVSVWGGAAGAVPTLEWRHRTLGGTGTWTRGELRQDESGTAGFSVWSATTDVVANGLRTRRVDVRCALADQLEREDRIVVGRTGYRISIALLVLAGAFVAFWLHLLPGLAVLLGLGGSVGVFGVGAIRGHLVQLGTRGPLRGLGPIERAVLVAPLVSLAAVLLPPLLLVIVENKTTIEAKATTPGKEQLSLPGRAGKSVLRWNTPLEIADDQLCMCPSARSVAGCSCTDEAVRFVPVHHIQCRRTAWDLGAPASTATFEGASRGSDGVVWRDADAACKANAEVTATFEVRDQFAGAEGLATVRLPWTDRWTKLVLAADAATPTVTVSGRTGTSPVLRIDDLTVAATAHLPAIDPAADELVFEWVDKAQRSEGKVTCRRARRFGADPIELVRFEVGSPTSSVVVQSDVTSTWSGPGRPRACVRGADPTVEVTLTEAVAGNVVRMPSAQVAVVVGSTRLVAPACRGWVALVKADPSPPRALDAGTRTWTVEPGPDGYALVCDPPAGVTEVTAGGPSATWLFGPRSLHRKPIAPGIWPICKALRSNLDVVSRARTCGAGCTTVTAGSRDAASAHEIERTERERGRPPCQSVCLCG